MPDQDAIPGDPVPNDPPAASVPAASAPTALSTGGPVPGNFSAQSALHLKTAGKALVNWWRAVTIEGLCVAVLWLIGLLLLKVPLAPVWALIAGLMTLVPNIGGVIALLGPAFSILVSQPDMYRLCFLLGMYAVIVVIDQLMLQPLIMKRVTRVPVWASILAAHRAWNNYSLLGNSPGAPLARRRLCFPPPPPLTVERPPA